MHHNEDRVSKAMVKKLLTYYHEYAYAGPKTSSPSHDNAVRSRPKNFDGISNSRLHKIMLDQAISSLDQLPQACVRARWIHQLKVGETITLLGVSRRTYYRLCDQAVEDIYRYMNGIKNDEERIGNVR